MLPARPAARKHFFFEKKKQKTFVTLARSYGQLGAKNQKFFGSFFQKRTFFLPAPPRRLGSRIAIRKPVVRQPITRQNNMGIFPTNPAGGLGVGGVVAIVRMELVSVVGAHDSQATGIWILCGNIMLQTLAKVIWLPVVPGGERCHRGQICGLHAVRCLAGGQAL
jgi:hypothetical protein